jgi:sugar lactone lactonase YvrE
MEPRTKIIVDNLRFPEAPRWRDGKLWFSNVFFGPPLRGQVMSVDLEGKVDTPVEIPDAPSGLGWTPDGLALIVSAQARRLLGLRDGRLMEVADLSEVVPYPCNDMVVDGLGRAYIGNMGYDLFSPGAAPTAGPILLVTPGSPGVKPRIVAEGLAFPNGMVITPDGQTLIVAESYGARLTAFTIGENGSLAHRRTWAQLGEIADPETMDSFGEDQITPDGICLDAEGAVWIASPNTNDVLRVLEGGEIVERIPVETVPIACMLGGPQRRTLFITSTGRLGLDESGNDGRIEAVEVRVPGAGLP